MAGVKKLTVLLLVFACVMMITTELAQATRVGPCDQVCYRIVPERHECCRAHGYSGYSTCSYGQMYCY